ncbi:MULTISPECIES: complex I subunit 5 family protein [Ectothiorhodospira]|nr:MULTISPECIES: proton-conducting transporter membrane subunit [Ectothiorhodospira]MCG5495889.1 oxidoreductase [Ectothiorhodospira variabilis]MCG5498388.1 oxidoreductase [Ectothiorhodospira variabilis]MCG5503042.1 oxidoreductase [Ectothiorhodospira variabilis]MCG5508447.1 oxidoreductase [Ectothiorhodospira variabilis]
MIEMPAIDWLTAVVFAPLAGAILAFLLPRQAHWVGVGAVVLTALMASALVLQVLTEGAVVTPLGNWGAPLGIDLRADGLSATLMAMTTGVGLLVSLGALNSYAHHRAPERMRRYFWPLWLLLLSGLNGVYLSTDLFNLYVMLEVISLAAVGLTVLSGRIEAVRAGLEYMYASILGALLFLLGVGFVYLELGRLDFAGLLAAPPSPALGAALALMVAGLALKTALFPLHVWLPQAHANATAPASALLSALVVKASLYIVLRLAQYLLPLSEVLVALIGLLGVGAILWGSIQALRAERLKLLVAWSTVAQIGLVFVAFARAGADGVAESWKAAALLMLAHAIAKAAMFLAAGRIKEEIGHDRIRELDRSPVRPTLAQLSFALAAISLVGLPPSLGFAGKWILMEGAMTSGYWHWIAVTMIATMLSVAYFSRVLTGFLRFDRQRTTVGEHQGWALADAAPLTLALCALGLGLLAAPILAFMNIGYPFGGAP